MIFIHFFLFPHKHALYLRIWEGSHDITLFSLLKIYYFKN